MHVNLTYTTPQDAPTSAHFDVLPRHGDMVTLGDGSFLVSGVEHILIRYDNEAGAQRITMRLHHFGRAA